MRIMAASNASMDVNGPLFMCELCAQLSPISFHPDSLSCQAECLFPSRTEFDPAVPTNQSVVSEIDLEPAISRPPRFVTSRELVPHGVRLSLDASLTRRPSRVLLGGISSTL
jgi:hypothetical protein